MDRKIWVVKRYEAISKHLQCFDDKVCNERMMVDEQCRIPTFVRILTNVQ